MHALTLSAQCQSPAATLALEPRILPDFLENLLFCMCGASGEEVLLPISRAGTGLEGKVNVWRKRTADAEDRSASPHLQSACEAFVRGDEDLHFIGALSSLNVFPAEANSRHLASKQTSL
ncbi:hypothetical protein EYF80_025030 [Liparis tanakae]|uniref:Uncharacterized protein n=1 Tax=Liparis tanakae TaxID=230148 RepID=A0A4Z2HIG8_9TELE|nr:hypothetical protein EYF80_025030 [Liparis tanakae]